MSPGTANLATIDKVVYVLAIPAEGAIAIIRPEVMWIFASFLTIALVKQHLLNMANPTVNPIGLFFRQCISGGMILFILTNWEIAVPALAKGFLLLGLKAGGSSASVEDFSQPSKIAGYGLKIAAPMMFDVEAFDGGWWSTTKAVFKGAWGLATRDTGSLIIEAINILIIVFTCMAMSIQFALAILELKYCSIWCFFMVPLAVLKPTRFAAETAKRYMFFSGLKLMIMGTLFSAVEFIAKSTAGSMGNKDAYTYVEQLSISFSLLFVFFLTWRINKQINAMRRGGPAEDAASVARVVADGTQAAMNPAAAAASKGSEMVAKAAGKMAGGGEQQSPASKPDNAGTIAAAQAMKAA